MSDLWDDALMEAAHEGWLKDTADTILSGLVARGITLDRANRETVRRLVAEETVPVAARVRLERAGIVLEEITEPLYAGLGNPKGYQVAGFDYPGDQYFDLEVSLASAQLASRRSVRVVTRRVRCDKRPAGGRPRGRRCRSSSSSTSRAGPSDAEPGEPEPPRLARRRAGGFACPNGGAA